MVPCLFAGLGIALVIAGISPAAEKKPNVIGFAGGRCPPAFNNQACRLC